MNLTPSSTSASAVPGITLHGAKAIALGVEAKIAAEVPPGIVVSSRHLTAAPLLSCESGGDNYSWPGQRALDLRDGADIDALMDAIVQTWQTRLGFTAELKTDYDDAPSITIAARDGGAYYVDVWRNGKELKIHSFSPRFHLPGGNNGDDY